MVDTLPPFPVDDFTLDQVEHALGARLTINDDGDHEVVGADFTLPKLLHFLSAYEPDKVVPLDEEGRLVEYVGGPIYTRDDIIRALITEIRQLRNEGSVP